MACLRRDVLEVKVRAPIRQPWPYSFPGLYGTFPQVLHSCHTGYRCFDVGLSKG
jgi:hypothetical protein